jgi:hypothetical protein
MSSQNTGLQSSEAVVIQEVEYPSTMSRLVLFAGFDAVDANKGRNDSSINASPRPIVLSQFTSKATPDYIRNVSKENILYTGTSNAANVGKKHVTKFYKCDKFPGKVPLIAYEDLELNCKSTHTLTGIKGLLMEAVPANVTIILNQYTRLKAVSSGTMHVLVKDMFTEQEHIIKVHDVLYVPGLQKTIWSSPAFENMGHCVKYGPYHVRFIMNPKGQEFRFRVVDPWYVSRELPINVVHCDETEMMSGKVGKMMDEGSSMDVDM